MEINPGIGLTIEKSPNIKPNKSWAKEVKRRLQRNICFVCGGMLRMCFIDPKFLFCDNCNRAYSYVRGKVHFFTCEDYTAFIKLIESGKGNELIEENK